MNPHDALIVTHHAHDAAWLKDILSRYQVTTRIVQSAEMALNSIEGCPPDLLIVDLVLPGMDGWELMYTLRQELCLDTRPVIAVTGDDADGVQEAALAEGFTAYFTKPLDADRFVPVLEQIVQLS